MRNEEEKDRNFKQNFLNINQKKSRMILSKALFTDIYRTLTYFG